MKALYSLFQTSRFSYARTLTEVRLHKSRIKEHIIYISWGRKAFLGFNLLPLLSP